MYHIPNSFFSVLIGGGQSEFQLADPKFSPKNSPQGLAWKFLKNPGGAWEYFEMGVRRQHSPYPGLHCSSSIMVNLKGFCSLCLRMRPKLSYFFRAGWRFYCQFSLSLLFFLWIEISDLLLHTDDKAAVKFIIQYVILLIRWEFHLWLW